MRPNYQSYDQSYSNYNQRPRGHQNQIVNYDQEVNYQQKTLKGQYVSESKTIYA